MAEVLLSSRKLTKKYGTNEVLHGIDLDILEGDFTVIMGTSGSGKSTLLYMLSGMDRPDSGIITCLGQEISSFSEKELTRLRAESFGFVFQKTYLISNLTLFENIVMAGYISGEKTEQNVRDHTKELIARMHLSGKEQRFPSQLSGGEAQRAAVARAVVSEPRLLFADEPTGALNKANTTELLNLLSDLNTQGQTILLVTHDREATLRGNRVLYLEDGVITSELSLIPWAGPDDVREKQLSDWLMAQGW